MVRNIFTVYPTIVDANGAFSIPENYPKPYDSNHYNNDVDKAMNRALSDAYAMFSNMLTKDTRQLQTVDVRDAYGNSVLDRPLSVGILAEVEPDQNQGE